MVFLIPYSKAQYEAFRQRAQAYLACPLPEYSGRIAPFGGLTGILYFEPDWTPHFRTFKIPYWRRTLTKPMGPMLKIALRPIFEQLTGWNPPPIQWGLIILTIGFVGMIIIWLLVVFQTWI